jgi:D-alanine-D-alanine ligase-like ATP-grasp enzyme
MPAKFGQLGRPTCGRASGVPLVRPRLRRPPNLQRFATYRGSFRTIGVRILRRPDQMSAPTPLIGQIFDKIAPRIGATVLFEPKWRVVGQITFKSGRKCYFRHNTIDLNSLGASDVAKDKDFANFFMERMGYRIVPGRAFYSAQWCKAIGSRQDIDAAYRYAKKIGLPVIVKPNSGSQGKGVSKVYTRHQFFKAARSIFKLDRVVLVQEALSGQDYRVVVLDGKIISAYQRVPLNVVGNGRDTIHQLLRKKQRRFIASSRDTRLKPHDPRIAENLKRQGLDFKFVLPKGQIAYLLDNANLSSGGDSIDITKRVHPEFRKLAIQLTKDMGLRLCGVDLMIEGDISKPPHTYWILEINAAPGLDHYARSGRAQQRIVEQLYLDVLKSMAKR